MLLSIMHFPDTFACPKVLEYLHVSPNIWFVWFTERLSRGDFYFYVDWLLYTMYERTNLSLDQQQFVFITSTSKKLSFVGFSRAKISVLLSLHPQWYQTWLPPFKNAPTTNIFAYNHLHNTLYVSLFYLCNDCKKSIHPSIHCNPQDTWERLSPHFSRRWSGVLRDITSYLLSLRSSCRGFY